MRIGLLGPLQVEVDGRAVEVAGSRLRRLLCRLAVDAGRTVPARELVVAVWPDDPPAEPANALQSLVSRLRRVLGGPGLLHGDGTGYRLALAPGDLDATVLAEHVRAGDVARTAGDLAAARSAYASALALWRGQPLADAGEADYVSAVVARWSALQLDAVRGRAECALLAGDGAGLVGELAGLAAAHPLDESLQLLRMRALVAAGRTPEALAAYEQVRRTLADELGTDPGPALAALHLELLRGPGPGSPAPPGTGRNNLRAGLTSFVGREAELDQVLAAVSEHRLATIVGPGGAGKTRLATEVATRWLAGGGEAAWLVELAPVTEAANIPTAVLGALGLRDARVAERAERAPQDPMERLLDALRGSRCLLVVDNCEHLVQAVAELVDTVLGAAPEVRVLATSREALGIAGEVLAPLAPLGLPPADVPVERATDFPAVRLWLDRARAVRRDFVLDAATLHPVVEIVRRLDGLPLAIELAAARLGVLPVAEIERRLADRFRLLTGGNRAALPRHRTLRAVVEWSWDLLTASERLLADRLAVFPAGTDLAGATAVCADDRLPADEVDGVLLALVEKSLLQSVGNEAGAVRFRMLETLREYGQEQLAARGELVAVRAAHAAYFARLVEQLEPVLRSREQLTALATLEAERENLLAALRHLGDSGRPAEALRMCLALVWYWSLLDSSSEAVSWVRFVVAANRGRDDPDLVYAEAALTLAEVMSGVSPDGTGPTSGRDRLVALAERVVDAPAPPFPGVDVLRPIIALFSGRSDLAQRALLTSAGSTDPWVRAAVETAVANFAENEGDTELMRTAAADAYTGFVAIGDRWGLSSVLLIQARLATLDGRLDDAVLAYREAARYVAELGSSEDEIFVRLRLGDVLLRRGEVEEARAVLAELRQSGDRPGLLGERELFADIALASFELQTGDADDALTGVAQLRRRAAQRPTGDPMSDHVVALGYAVAALVEAACGDVDQAARDLAIAYPAGVGTADMPVLSSVGVSVAAVALRLGEAEQAAAMLGAAAQLRGGDDPTDTTVRRIATAAREALGAGYDAAYASGRSLPRPEAVARIDPALLATAAQARLR